jgi:uncharacterized membrane protein YsdA (DUF1294 family)
MQGTGGRRSSQSLTGKPRPPIRSVSRPQKPRRGHPSLLALLLLAGLLLFPALASWRLAQWFGAGSVCGYLLAASSLAFGLYWDDKRSAEAARWRTRESTLHLVEIIGGWPGSFLGQRIFRHKIRKTRYQVVFWLIVVLHEAVAFDFLSEWRYSHAALGFLGN